MRGNLKLIRTAIFGVTAGAALVAFACTSAPPKSPGKEVVAKEDVLPGFSADECAYVYESAQPEQPSGGFGGPSSGQMMADRTKAVEKGNLRTAHCRHAITDEVQRCFDDNGVDHPLEWCKARKAARDAGTPPTSGSPQEHCGSHDGLLMLCGDES